MSDWTESHLPIPWCPSSVKNRYPMGKNKFLLFPGEGQKRKAKRNGKVREKFIGTHLKKRGEDEEGINGNH